MKGPDAYALTAAKTGGRPGSLKVAAGEIWDTAQNEVITFAQLTERLASAQVVYVGESHDGWQHHHVQAQLLEALSRGGPPFAVGLEMLPRTVQPALDAFCSSTTNEREFLEGGGWYEHWGYDYRYYRPIFELARARKLAVLGLNVPSKVTRQVGREGLKALEPATRKELPPVYLGSKEHRRVFEALIGGAPHHPRTKKKAPHHGQKKQRRDRFYQAQSLWDEAMAERVAATMSKVPKGRVMVFAGSGHLIYDLGISMRLRRRLPDLRQAIVVPVRVEKGRRRIARQLADFIVGVPPDAPHEAFPTLGVMLTEKEGVLTVKGLEEEGAAARAGVQKDDRLSKLDGHPISKIVELRAWLFGKAWGDSAKVELLRGKQVQVVEVRFKPSQGE
ncbi:MAG: ChaN family lipoprotein [Deltaproteobacteria bacterium]|nr:ChaN family lipoprotein [Deltaproteobacteria bacterium]